MKKAVLILSIILMIIVFVQSWLVGIGGSMFDDQMLAWGGLVGRIVALLFAVGAAFVLPRPLIAVFIYLAGGLLGIIFGIYTGYYDMILWGGLALALGGGSYYAWSIDEPKAVPAAAEQVKEASRF
ncbi:MAG: hypothetical protein GX883_01475 [Firmicutes bacterium]|nr:hypothetical protein [Bacillota bacterium]